MLAHEGQLSRRMRMFMKSNFIRFVNQKKYLIDDIRKGFKLRKHSISFQPSLSTILPSVIEFWKELNLKPKYADEIVKAYDEYSDNDFNNWLANKLTSDKNFNAGLSFGMSQIRNAEIKMKCFTELRDNQKLNTNHKNWFGGYGISFSKEWIMKNRGDRVIYVDRNSELTNRIGRILSMLFSFNPCSSIIKSAFDVLSFTEIEGNSHEYEWRIVGNHEFAGNSYGDHPDLIPFKNDDITGIYVEHENEIDEFLKILKDKSDIEENKRIPQIYLNEDVFLSEEEQKAIDRIHGRRS
jgi:hypothetical protein